MARVQEVAFHASAVQLEAAGTVNGTAHDCSVFEEMSAILSVTVSSGTAETLDVKIQVSVDGTIWTDLVTFTQAVGVTQEYKGLTCFGKWLRAVSAVGSGAADGSFTFSVIATGKMHV